MAFEHYDKCSLLLPMDGANNGTVFTDWSVNPKTVTRNGDAKTVTAQYKYYGSSIYFDGTGDYLTTPNTSEFAIENKPDFTISAWANVQSLSTSRAIISNRPASLTEGFGFRINTDGSLFFYFTGAGTLTSPVGLITTGSFVHLSAIMSSGMLSLYINGLSVAGPTDIAAGTTSGSVNLFIGAESGGGNSQFHGYLQDLLFIKGNSLWTENFTPPPRLIGELSNANALAPVEDEAGTPSERTIIAVPRSYPTRAFGTVSDVNGDFTLRAPAVDCSIIALHEGSPSKNDLIYRVTPV